MGTTNLVDHHDCEQVTDGRKEQAVKVMLDTVADGVAKDVQNYLADNEEEDAKNDIAHRPAVLESAENENDLADEVNEEENGVHDVRNDEDADGVLSIQTGPVLESEKGDGTANDEHAERGQSQQPDRQCCSILVQLETNKSVDQQAGAERRDKTILNSGEVGVGGRARRSDSSVEDEGYDSEKKVDVEERGNLFATCTCELVLFPIVPATTAVAQHTDSSELGTDMYYHNHCHYQGQNVHEVVRCLEDERVGDLNRSCIALCLYAGAAVDFLVAHEGAQWYRRLFA